MAQDDRKNQTNSPGLYEQFAEIVNPEVQKMMSNAVSGGTYDELFQKASNSVLKRLGLLSPTSGLTTPENQIDPYRVLAANGSKNTSVSIRSLNQQRARFVHQPHAREAARSTCCIG